MPPYTCRHPLAAILLLPSVRRHPLAAIHLRPSTCLHPLATICLPPSARRHPLFIESFREPQCNCADSSLTIVPALSQQRVKYVPTMQTAIPAMAPMQHPIPRTQNLETHSQPKEIPTGFIRKKLRNYPCTSVRTTCVGSFASIASFASICSSGKDSEYYRSNHPLTEARKASKASKATDAPPILPTQPPTIPMQPPTLPMQPPPYGS